VSEVVADASPLIALQQIGSLHFLEPLFGGVLVPPAVAREIAPSVPLAPFIEERAVEGPGVWQVAVFDLASGLAVMRGEDALFPSFSPDGRRVAYSALVGEAPGVLRLPRRTFLDRRPRSARAASGTVVVKVGPGVRYQVYVLWTRDRGRLLPRMNP
jgi:hypothetical protein